MYNKRGAPGERNPYRQNDRWRLAAGSLALVLFVGFWGTVFYVAWHFITKFW